MLKCFILKSFPCAISCLVSSWPCPTPCQSIWMCTTSVSRHPGFSFSPCTGRAPSLPSQLSGENVFNYSCSVVCYPRAHIFILPSFTSVLFSQEANTSLVRACWNELFTLGLAQCAHVMNLSTILAAIINHLQSTIQDGMDHRPRHHFTVGLTHLETGERKCDV